MLLPFLLAAGLLLALTSLGCELWYRRAEQEPATQRDARMNSRLERCVCWLLLVGCLGVFAYALVTPARGDEQEAADVEDDTLEVRRQMLARNNAIRTTRSLQPHKENAALMAAAQNHARYMAKNRVMSHYVNGNPSSRAKQAGFAAPYVLENIAYGYAGVDTTFRVWVNSGGHYANLTSNTSDAGFGWAISIDGSPYWCAVYGTPPGESPQNAPPTSTSSNSGRRRRWLGWIFGN